MITTVPDGIPGTVNRPVPAPSSTGAKGADGANVSIVTGRAGPIGEALPAGSLTIAVIDQSPSDNAGNSQLDTEGEATYEHETDGDPGFEALIVTKLPSGTEPPDNSGVESDVRSSEDEAPKSLPATKSGAKGADGADVSIVTGRASVVPALPARSVTDAATDQFPSSRIPSVHDDTAPTV
jgi:hypothetical protein